MFPGLVFVYDPAFGCYRPFMTGGSTTPDQWRRGSYRDRHFFRNLREIGRPTVPLAPGVYALVH